IDGDLEQLPRLLPFWDELDPGKAQAVTRALEALQARHKAEQATAALRDHLYRLAWQPAEAVTPGAGSEGRRWLILADRRGVGAHLAQRLGAHGHDCRLLFASDAAGAPAAIDSLVSEATPLGGVAHLWSLDLPVEAGVAALEAMQ